MDFPRKENRIEALDAYLEFVDIYLKQTPHVEPIMLN